METNFNINELFKYNILSVEYWKPLHYVNLHNYREDSVQDRVPKAGCSAA